MAYLIDYSRYHYERLERIRTLILGVLLLCAIVAGGVGLVIRGSYHAPTLRDILTGPYNDDVNKLADLHAEWRALETAHTNIAPYLQLVWSPQTATNVLATLIRAVQGPDFPAELHPLNWELVFDGRDLVGSHAGCASNLSVRLAFSVDWLNVSKVEAIRAYLTGMFPDAGPVELQGLVEETERGEVQINCRFGTLRLLPVSQSLKTALDKVSQFRAEIRSLTLDKKGEKKFSTLEDVALKSPAEYRRNREAFERSLDPSKVMRSYLTPIDLDDASTRILGEWDKMADARLPWSRKPGRTLLRSKNYVSHGTVKGLLEQLPGTNSLRQACRKLCRQCEPLTNAMPIMLFHTIESKNLHGTELAPEGIEIPMAEEPDFEVQRPALTSPDWTWIKFDEGSSNRVAFVAWSYKFRRRQKQTLPLDELPRVAQAISASGRGYAVNRIAVVFDAKTHIPDKVEIGGLVPLLYPADDNQPETNR